MIKIKLCDWKTFYPGQVMALPDEMAKRLVAANIAQLMERETATVEPPEYRTAAGPPSQSKRRRRGND